MPMNANDIEKLIKRPLEVQTLALDKPSRHRHDERGGERGGRRERDEHRGASARRSGSSERSGHHRRHEAPVDDFFLKPYEPSVPATQPEETQSAQQHEKKGPKRQVAALLGGFGMPRKPSA